MCIALEELSSKELADSTVCTAIDALFIVDDLAVKVKEGEGAIGDLNAVDVFCSYDSFVKVNISV